MQKWPPQGTLKLGLAPLEGKNKIFEIIWFIAFKSTGYDTQFQRKNW